MVIIPDGGDSLGKTIEIAEKNLMWIQFHIQGKQAHGSRPDEGANACLAGYDLALRVNNLEKVFDKRDELFEPPYSTFQPTKKESNVPNINTIPGDDVFCMDCRILPCYKLDFVKSEGILIKTGDGILCVKELQRQGKKSMFYKDFMNGARNFVGTVLGM